MVKDLLVLVYREIGSLESLRRQKAMVLEDNSGLKAIRYDSEKVCGGGGQPVLVFYSFRHDMGNIKAAIPEAEEFSDGDTLRRWNEGRIPVLLAHPASVGYGLNMQAGGHIIVWYGLTWSLETYEQANARLYRQGQSVPVIIHHIIAKDTVDEAIMSALRNKKKGQDALMEAVKAMVKEVKR